MKIDTQMLLNTVEVGLISLVVIGLAAIIIEMWLQFADPFDWKSTWERAS